MKRSQYLLLFSLIAFLILDCKSYYYGFGEGFVSKKIPNHFSVNLLFGGSDLGYQGMSLLENDIGRMYIIVKNKNITTVEGVEMTVGKFLGYYFNKEIFIAKILDENNKIVNVEVIPKKSSLDATYIYHDLSIVSGFNEKDLKYVNLDKSIMYFQYFRLLKNISFIALIIFLLLNILQANKIFSLKN